MMGAYTIDLDKIQETFEAIPNVRVAKIFYDDVDKDWVGAVVIIDDDKVLILRNFKEKHFSENSNESIEIARIGNYRVAHYYYGYPYHGGGHKQVWRSNFSIGKNSFYNKIFDLGEINGIENVIKNFDLILSRVEQLPDDDYSLSNPHNNYGFWNPNDLESKNNLLYYSFSNGGEVKIGKIKFDEIIDFSILNKNINYSDLLKFE